MRSCNKDFNRYEDFKRGITATITKNEKKWDVSFFEWDNNRITNHHSYNGYANFDKAKEKVNGVFYLLRHGGIMIW